jgi:hypothetical protein
MSQHISKIKFVFHKEYHVERSNFSSLIEAFDPRRMTPQGLRMYCGTLQITFDGYREERRLPFLIPQVRAFLRDLRQAWPHAAYFCDLGNDYLGIEAASHINHMRVLQRDGEPDFHLWIATEELNQYIAISQESIDALGRRAGMSRAKIRERQERYAEYIQFRLG